MSEHDHPHPAPAAPPPEVTDDAASQALSEALKSSFTIIKFLMIGLVGIFLVSGFFQVGTQEKAIILRFGKPVGGEDKALLGPGPHWALPAPIDEVVKIPIGQIQTASSTVGWYATSATREAANTEPPPGPSLNPAVDGYVLTADGNIMHMRGTMLYRIAEPGIRYEFDFVSASNIVQNVFNSAMLYAAANYTVDNALTRDIAGFRDKVRARVEQLIAQYKLGVTVDQINLQTIPPRQLTAAFAAVLEAEVRRGKGLNDARSYENQMVNRAKSEAAARINAGETDRNRLVEFVAAEAKRFNDLLPAYRSNPEFFIQQRQTEVLQRVLTNAQDKIVLPDRPGGKPVELRIELNREPTKPRTLEPPPADTH